jgi:Trypsin-co-occurring domain 1
MDATEQDQVLIQVVSVDGRQIGWGANVTERLDKRIDDVKDAIVKGSSTVAASLGSLASPKGWKLDEVTASFGVTLTAQAGVLLTAAASGQATFEVSVSFKRAQPGDDGDGQPTGA